LLAAFSRSLRDPFVHARHAALMAFAATVEHFSEEDCAMRILPTLCPLLLDKEKAIRDQASKTLDIYLQRTRKAAEAMPESAAPPPSTTDPSAAPRMSTPQPSEGASASWAGWAISSFTNKLSAAAGEIQANGLATPVPATSPGPAASQASGPASASALHRQAVTSPPPPMTRTSSTGTGTAAMFQDADDGADAWGEIDDDGLFDAPEDQGSKKKATGAAPTSSLPYKDDEEPDFAGWLAAQSQKKAGNKPLPKGLGKSKPAAGRTAAKVPASTRPPVAKKKIDTKPKEEDVDDDAWGDGW
jgi:SCY1-like protein 1